MAGSDCFGTFNFSLFPKHGRTNANTHANHERIWKRKKGDLYLLFLLKVSILVGWGVAHFNTDTRVSPCPATPLYTQHKENDRIQLAWWNYAFSLETWFVGREDSNIISLGTGKVPTKIALQGMIQLVQGQLFKVQGTPSFAWNVDYF